MRRRGEGKNRKRRKKKCVEEVDERRRKMGIKEQIMCIRCKSAKGAVHNG